MKQVIHFDSQKERLAYLRGEYEEIKPIKAKSEAKMPKTSVLEAENEKNSQNKETKSKKTKKSRKKDSEDGKVQAE